MCYTTTYLQSILRVNGSTQEDTLGIGIGHHTMNGPHENH